MNDKFYRKQFRVKGARQVGDETDAEVRAYYEGIISSDELDTYFSRMSESTLKNFAEDAANGVTVLDSHRHNTAGIGMTTDSKYDNGKVYSDFYLVRDIPLGDSQSYSNTDGFIKMLNDGALRDISVGFYGGTEYCDICNVPIWYSRDCMHFPGIDYIIVDEDTEEKVIVTCTTTIDDARLSEISLVYDGANEDSEITVKANKLAENGEINIKQKHLIENRFNVRFKQGLDFPESKDKAEIDEIKNQGPDKKIRATGGDNSMTKEELEQQVAELEEQITQLRSNVDTWKEKGARAAELEVENSELKTNNDKLEKRQSDDSDTISRMVDEKAVLQKDVDSMKPMADEGERYRKEEEALAYTEFVRFRGEDLDEEKGDSERAKNHLANLPSIKDVRDMGETWAETADIKYPEGRKTTDTDGSDDKPEGDDTKEDVDVLPTADAY